MDYVQTTIDNLIHATYDGIGSPMTAEDALEVVEGLMDGLRDVAAGLRFDISQGLGSGTEDEL